MKLTKLIVAAAIALAVTPSMAWGDREQGILAGAALLLLGQQIFNTDRTQPQYLQPFNPPQVGRYFPQGPVYIQQSPIVEIPQYRSVPGGFMDVCRYVNQQAFIYDLNGRVVGWQFCN